MIPLVKPYFPPREELMPALEEILYSGYVATGQPVFDFEDKFKAYIGNDNIISVHSGTDALHLAYILAGVKPGDEIISTPMTAEPTNTSIAMVGAKVVWGDVDPKNGLLDPNSVRMFNVLSLYDLFEAFFRIGWCEHPKTIDTHYNRYLYWKTLSDKWREFCYYQKYKYDYNIW